MIKHISLWTFLVILISISNGCSDKTTQNLYRYDGFSVSHPDNWIFYTDSENPFFGVREVAFSLGEFSFAAFYIQEKDTVFSEFVDFYLHKAQLSAFHPETEIEQSNTKVASYDAVVTSVTSEFIGEPLNTTVYSINITLEKKNIYFMSLIAHDDKVSIVDDLEDVIESLQLSY